MPYKNSPPPPRKNNFAKGIAWRCPCDNKARLKPTDSGFVCTRPSCIHAKPKNQFGMVGDTPILVSTRLCDTVCDPATITPYVPAKRKTYYYRLLDLMAGKSKTTRRNCREFVRQIKSLAKKPKVLVVGAGSKGAMTESLWEDEAIEMHGVDIYASPNVDAVCDGHYLPLPNAEYDGVWIQAVLEHVVDPSRVVAEIHRVLRPNGVVYAETPFMQQVHGGGHDFTRFTVLGHRYLFRHFRLMAMGGNRGAEVALVWSLRYFTWAVTGSRILFHLANGFWLLLRPFGVLVREKSLYDSPSGVYFMGSKSDKLEVTHKQLVGLYKGLN